MQFDVAHFELAITTINDQPANDTYWIANISTHLVGYGNKYIQGILFLENKFIPIIVDSNNKICIVNSTDNIIHANSTIIIFGTMLQA